MDQMELLFPKDAWRCQQCQKLIHNTDRDGYPIKGAPLPRNFNSTYSCLCTVCYTLIKLLYDKGDYWRLLQAEWEEEECKRKKNNDKLKGGNDYFTGA